VENFGWNFSANPHSEPEGMALSSGAVVTAAVTVQLATNVNGKSMNYEGHEVSRRNIVGDHIFLRVTSRPSW